jgi:tetratricopeptide (TPR) repeat protein
MELYPPLEVDRRWVADQANDGGLAQPIQRLIALSSWMIALGTVRLVCMLADYVGVFIEAARVEPVTMRMLGRLADEVHPVVALSSAWPLILAIALRRTRWPQLLPAAAATFLILSIGGVIELSARWSQVRGYGATVGSFHLTRRAFLNPTISDLSLITLGATQLLVELATAIRVILLIPRFRRAKVPPAAQRELARSSRYGRMAMYTSFGFLVLMIRLPVWSTYLEVLNNSTFVRDFVIKSEGKPTGRRRFGPTYSAHATPEEKRFQDLSYLLAVSAQDAQNGRFLDAKDRYQKIIATIDSLPEDSLSQDGRPLIAQALNNLAWMEATCPHPGFLNPKDAVRHARRATVVQPEEGNYWNTLGAAHYRAGEYEDAKTALAHSMALRREGDSFDWFFLALVELKLGQKAEARRWYDKAVEWFQQSAPRNPELYRFQVEAAEELGLPRPEASELASANAVPPNLQPASIHRLLRRKNAEASLNAPSE